MNKKVNSVMPKADAAVNNTGVDDSVNNRIQENEVVTELSEDMEMVSPGSMLLEAREALSLSQEHIATKLNFKLSLVNDIEQDIYDPKMPITFNRGYLTNYAKLVGVDVEDVLASYDVLDAATLQRSEMLSFSKETSKQAEHSRVMWLSYIIVAVLCGLTILWWLQDSRQQDSRQQDNRQQDTELNSTEENVPGSIKTSTNQLTGELDGESIEEASEEINKESPSTNAEATIPVTTSTLLADKSSTGVSAKNDNNALVSSDISVAKDVTPQEVVLSTAVFTFNGDCWVNVFDATGERIAWGVKKLGYVMTIQGQAPLQITVGKPELTTIVFNDQPVDMSRFNLGNIAKFTLPMDVE